MGSVHRKEQTPEAGPTVTSSLVFRDTLTFNEQDEQMGQRMGFHFNWALFILLGLGL